jgi:hypothetical protein
VTMEAMVLMMKALLADSEQKNAENTRKELEKRETQLEDKLERFKDDIQEDVHRIDVKMAKMHTWIEKAELDIENQRDYTENRLEMMAKKIEEKMEGLMKPKPPGSTPEKDYGEWTEVAAKGKAKGKGKGKEEVRNEEMSRTVVFGGYGAGSAAADIVKHLTEIAEEAKVEKQVEDIFAFGRKWANGGGLRFKSTKDMWDYMKSKRGEHVHEYKGGRIYGRVGFVEDENAERSKAMRKAVRAMIETEEGTAGDIKDNMTARYSTGVLLYKGNKIAEWKAGVTMEWHGMEKAASKYEELIKETAAR